MSKEIFEAFAGQPDMFGYSQAVRVGDTSTSRAPLESGRVSSSLNRWPSKWSSPTVTWARQLPTSALTCHTS
jgi:hypothetical protein